MGGCCCSSRKPQFHGTPVYYYVSGLPVSPRKVELELLKSNTFSVSATNEEDACPTCLEEYDAENPKIMTKCNHHFHLSCILEWMERSDTCPICNQRPLPTHSFLWILMNFVN
ncbi:hypothetical protein Pfo_001181 [Paulownia fortunei]|nr:hypothetical protein Pfo_001181 [Paulownia fortunei]